MAAKDKDDEDSEPGDTSFEELARKAEAAELAAKKASAAADDDEPEDGDEEARDASTKGVAKALGVDQDPSDKKDDDEQAAAKEQAAVQNRAARRREEALKKRASREKSSSKSALVKRKDDQDDEAEQVAADDDDDDVAPARDALPKDRNARAKELLKRRQQSISGKSSSAIGLSAGEVVSDQVARAAAGTGKWVKANFRYIVGGIVLAIGVVGGVLYYFDHEQKQLGVASDTLIVAVESEYGFVFNDENKDPRPPETKQFDPTPVFASHSARREAVLTSYDKVIAAYPGSGTALLATLGKAGALLDSGKYDEAYSAYDEVGKSELAKADLDVRARTIEGKAFALEAKKDNDAAMAAFRELGNVDKTYEDLSSYHQARIHLKKGEKDKAKELLTALNKKLELPTLDGPQNRHLRTLVELYMRAIDPTSVRKNRPSGGADRKLSDAEIQEIFRRQMQQQKEHGDEHGDDEGDEMPFPIPLQLPEGDHDDGSR